MILRTQLLNWSFYSDDEIQLLEMSSNSQLVLDKNDHATLLAYDKRPKKSNREDVVIVSSGLSENRKTGCRTNIGACLRKELLTELIVCYHTIMSLIMMIIMMMIRW